MINKVTPNNTFHINNNRNNKKTSDAPSFKGVPLSVLRFLNQSPAIGACTVDLCSMVIPRSVIETKNRGKQSGIETFVRECGSCLINASVGLIGFLASKLISGKFNEKYGVKAQHIFADENFINNMGELWKNTEGDQKKFFEGFVSSLEGLNGTARKKVSEEAKTEIVDGFMNWALKNRAANAAKGAERHALKTEAKEIKNIVIANLIKETGAETSYKIKPLKEGFKEIRGSAGELADNAVRLSNALLKNSDKKLPEFIKALKANKVASTIVGMAICSILCISVQPINKFLTKKRTGNDGFVGVEGGQKPDKSPKFKALKNICGVVFPTFAISTIGNPAELLSNIQFNSKIPTLKQFKLLYGMTIASRFFSARDGNELREGVIKDTLGFVNWLILGGVVSKLTARVIGGKELINTTVKPPENGIKGIRYALKWLTKSSVKSYDEVLLPAAKEIVKDGKLVKFGELVKNASPEVKSKIAKIAISQAVGYLYSGLVLGMGIAKLNIFITKQIQSKKTAKMTFGQDNIPRFDTEYMKKMNSLANPVFKDFK